MKLKENLQPKSHTIRRFTKTVQTHVYDEWIREQALEHLRTAQETYPNKYNSPQRSEDKLFPADYRHKHQRPGVCPICRKCTAPSKPVCGLALASTCEDLECDEGRLLDRNRLAAGQIQQNPMVHWGKFASADTVLKSATERDRICTRHGVIAFEMEANGACDIFPCIVIKGACDYADSHKNKKWQKFAAVTAACVMKALLQWFPKTDQRAPPPVYIDSQVSLTAGREYKYRT